ncbi:hypothetical protein, partial [Kordia sp.]|uniref:hypothetical protein n=1 Tax=Kordia sp. TaxID=1965332 RepID=UPI003D6AF00B
TGVTTTTTIILSDIDSGSCNAALTNTTSVTINSIPAVTALTSNSPICSGDDAVFTITGTANATVSYSTDGGTTTQMFILNGTGTA